MFVSNNLTNKSVLHFSGVYKQIGSLTSTEGKAYRNKLVVKVRDFVYHPFPHESANDIANIIRKQNKAYSFSLIEKDDFHTEGQYFLIQRVVLGDTVSKAEAKKNKNFNLKQNFLTKDLIYDTYNNSAHGVVDLSEIEPKKINKLLADLSKNT